MHGSQKERHVATSHEALDNLHTLRTRQQHMAEELVDNLMTVLLTPMHKKNEDANL